MLNLIRQHFSLYTFCFSCMFFVGLGQTFFVSQYIPFIREDLNLTRSQISLYYSLATFVASFNLPYLGKLLDKYSPWKFFLLTNILLSLGLVILSYSKTMPLLILGFYLLRGFGQVPLGLLASTTVSKYLGKNRGKFLTIAGIGRPIGEGIIPFIAILLIASFGWRHSILIFLAALIFIMFPLAKYLTPKLPTTPLYPENDQIRQSREKEENKWNWGKVFKLKWPLYIMLNNSLLPFILTGLFFQQDAIAAFKGWDLKLMSYSYASFSIIHVAGNLFWGPLIDKITAKNVLPFVLIPMFLGILILSFFDSSFIVYIYMGLNGLSVGASGLVRNTFWAEIYGTKNLGTIKGMDSNIIVMGTALAPIIYASLLDNGVSTQNLMYLLAGMTFIGIINCSIISFKYKKV